MLPPASIADSGGSYIAQLDDCEKTLVGKTSSGVPIEIRLETLEKNLFGQIGAGSIGDRLQAIKQTLIGCRPAAKAASAAVASAKTKPQVAGQIAPKLDHAAMDKSAQSTPGATDVDIDRSLDHIKDLLRQAVIAHTKGDMANAKKLFEQVLSIDPNNTDANYNLGAMAEERGDLKLALLCYRMAAASAPDDSDIANAAASVERKLQRSAAQQAAGQASDPNQLKDLARNAAQAFRAGKYDAAISDLQLIADQEPTDASVQYGLARAWRSKGDLSRARHHLTRAISLAPNEQLYADDLQVLDKQIQARQTDGDASDSDSKNVAEVRHATGADNDANQAALKDDSHAGDIQPFTDQAAPHPLVGYAGERGQPVGAYSGGGLAPIGAFAVVPVEQAVAGTLASMAALGAMSRSYPTYSVYPGVRYGTKSRIARGVLAGGLLGLFTRGW